ncbi:MAG TPA: hypothetical protein VHL31_03490 [Geminicoccus sp.]|uniref:hypothetical protein n=1 Tax=Geminicoccus sp. TaxID=2024832 RepID=UPI002E308704|nr:hypothetical protein [Geminicoccus sp.]HEX2525351.1 hypothetical protein [Geminicoccus sp.]
MSRRSVVVLLAALATVQAQGALAEDEGDGAMLELPCSRYDRIRQQLREEYAEEPVSLGLQSNGHLLQVFASAESGTWTIVSTAPSGTACVVAAGHDWETLPPARDASLDAGKGA